jgi:hypothetical protein
LFDGDHEMLLTQRPRIGERTLVRIAVILSPEPLPRIVCSRMTLGRARCLCEPRARAAGIAPIRSIALAH